MRTLLLALLPLALTACDSASPIARPGEVSAYGVTFRVDRTEVRRGDAVELALVNDSDAVVQTGVFGCDVVERLVDDAWVQREADNDRACILPIVSVSPGKSYEGAFVVDVAPGTVRLKHTFFVDDDGTATLASPPIRVLR